MITFKVSTGTHFQTSVNIPEQMITKSASREHRCCKSCELHSLRSCSFPVEHKTLATIGVSVLFCGALNDTPANLNNKPG